MLLSTIVTVHARLIHHVQTNAVAMLQGEPLAAQLKKGQS